MRKIDPKLPISQFGCISNDRHVGPWEEVSPGYWVRRGPEGFRNLFNDCAACVGMHSGAIPAGSFAVYAPDGLTEESGHVWGSIDTKDVPNEIGFMKKNADETLRVFGWIVDGVPYQPPSRWQRFKQFWGLS